jgi:3-deoxy-7-phosphoheptulonate synthase
MIVIMDEGATEEHVEAVIARLVGSGRDVHRSSGQARTILGVVGAVSPAEVAVTEELAGVSKVVEVTPRFHRASRAFRHQSTIIEGEWGRIGAERPWVAIEAVGLPQDEETASGRPASLPYLVLSGRPFDAAIVRGAEPPDQIGALACLTVHPSPMGTRSPLAFVLRDPSWGTDEWLETAEHAIARGGSHVALLEAGGCHPGGRRTLDVVALSHAAAATHLPIVVDVPTIARRAGDSAAIAGAALAAGAAGVILRASPVLGAGGPVAPAALSWDAAVSLAERLRSMREALTR